MAALAGGYAVLRRLGGARIDLPWIALTVDLGAMAYMWAMMDGVAWAPVTYALTACCLAEAGGWFWRELHGRRGVSWSVGRTRRTGRAGAPYLAGTAPLAHRTTRMGAAALGLMALGMAHMLVAMQVML
jgi:hypothetical protein